ncbi:MAG: cobalamin B12-binding domain-containing protein [Chloroflexi bacterium]|nr:cobalamin B12-binding domain-containing protein [Chloroflexota bacterium]
MRELEQSARELGEALLSINRLAAREVITTATAKWGAVCTMEELIAPTLERIGAGWERGEVALSQVYMASLICEEMLPAISPTERPARRQPKMAIAVLEDHHQLGKRMVAQVLRAGGFELLDYGHGVRADSLVDRALGDDVGILLISTLMLPSALRVKEVRSRLSDSKTGIRLVVGGAPFLFDADLWQEVGADAMGRCATDAIRVVTALMDGEGGRL